MTRLALIRHGRTAYTEAHRLQGRRDEPLSDPGRVQVGACGIPGQLDGFAWIASPLSRALETARILAGPSVRAEPRIIEMDWGTWEGRTLRDLRAELGPVLKRNEDQGLDFSPEGGESPRQVLERLRPWLVEIGKGDRNIAAVTHKGVMRAILAAAIGWDMLGPSPEKLDWTCAHVFAVDRHGNPTVHALNIPLVGADAAIPSASRQAM